MATLRSCARLARRITGLNSLSVYKSTSQRFVTRRFNVTASHATNEKPTDSAEQTADEKQLSVEQQKIAELEKSLNEEREKLTGQMEDYKDKYVRSLAEMENVRQRLKKQVDDAKLFAVQGFCKDLLEVADILSKATESVPQDALTDNNPHLKNLYEGLTMTNSQLLKVFTRHGLMAIEPKEGEKFDPNIHEALFQQPASDKPSGTIAIVTKIGYKLHERTIRPAVVGVYK